MKYAKLIFFSLIFVLSLGLCYAGLFNYDYTFTGANSSGFVKFGGTGTPSYANDLFHSADTNYVSIWKELDIVYPINITFTYAETGTPYYVVLGWSDLNTTGSVFGANHSVSINDGVNQINFYNDWDHSSILTQCSPSMDASAGIRVNILYYENGSVDVYLSGSKTCSYDYPVSLDPVTFNQLILFSRDVSSSMDNMTIEAGIVLPNYGYEINITEFNSSGVSNSSVTLNWEVISNATILNITLFRDSVSVFSGNESFLNYSFLDTGLAPNTAYEYLLNVTFNKTLYATSTISVVTNANAQILSNIAVWVITLLYVFFMALGYIMMKTGNFLSGVGLWVLSCFFDFFIIAWLFENNLKNFIQDNIFGYGVYILGIGFIYWIFLKLSMPFILKGNRIKSK